MPGEPEEIVLPQSPDTDLPPKAAETLPTAEALPTADEAAAWLAVIKPAAVLALLKETDFRAAVAPAFAGFRPDAKSFSLPLVRTRLAQAASKDQKLAQKLRSLAEAAQEKTAQAQAVSVQADAPDPQTPTPPKAEKPDPLPALRAERDARRRERDAARLELKQVQTERDGAIKAQAQAQTERDEFLRQAKKQSERISRLERQAAQARQTEARLVRALNEDKVSPPPAPRSRSAGSEPPQKPLSADTPWRDAARRLLERGKLKTALALAEDVLKADSENTDALQIAASALEASSEPRPALAFARRLLALQVQQPGNTAAADTLLCVFRLAASPADAEPDVRAFLAALSVSDSEAVAAARLMLGRLRGVSPAAHGWLAEYLTARTTLAPVLMPPPEALGPDDPLPLPIFLGRPVTARQIADAVDRAQPALIDAARAALSALGTADPDTSARIWAALEAAASDDPARLTALRRKPRGAAVVDGSNVAWFDQESLVHGQPRLRSLLSMRRTLWTRGFFPVLLYGDANLPYFIDDRPALLALRDRAALTLVDAGTTADEALLRVAKQMGAALITNDKMEDWDPEGEVRKVRYMVSMNGEAHLLSEV